MTDAVLAFIDTHAHLDDSQFDADRDAVIAGALAAGVTRMVNVGYSPATWVSTSALADRYPGISCVFGLHPNYAEDVTDAMLDDLRSLLRNRRPVAIGETGLDYFRDRAGRDRQIAAFTAQVALAAEFRLPVVLHLRGDVEPDLIPILDAAPDHLVFLFHSFDGSPGLATVIRDRGWYIGVGGLITRRSNRVLRDLVQQQPIDRIVLETDSPYLAPTNWPSRRNDPSAIPQVASALAGLHDLSVESVARQTTSSACRLFGLADETVVPEPVDHARTRE